MTYGKIYEFYKVSFKTVANLQNLFAYPVTAVQEAYMYRKYPIFNERIEKWSP
jgi:hypothetical protein